MPITAVIVKGERQFTTDKAIQYALQDLMRSSFFNADVTQVQRTLEGLPWVYRASVRKEWPAKLNVFIQEQQAASHWNGDAWLNEHGEVFDAPAQESLAHLPQLAGPENMAQEILISYQRINELLGIHGHQLRGLNLSPRHAWQGTLSNSIMLELGREDKIARIQRFIDVYPTLVKQPKVVAKVDLRYDTGLAIGWDDREKESR